MLNCDNFNKIFENTSLAARAAFVEYFNGYDNNYLEMIEEEDLDTFIEVMNESLNLMKEELLKQKRNYKSALNEAFGALNKIARNFEMSTEDLVEALHDEM